MIRELNHLWFEATKIWQSGAAGRLLLFASALAVGSVLALAYPVVRGRAPLKRVPLASALASTGVMLGCCFWLVSRARQFFLTLGPWDPPGAAVTGHFADSYSLEELAVKFVGIGLLVICTTSILIALRARGSKTVRALVLVCAALAIATVWVAVDNRVTFYWNASYEPVVTYPLLRKAMAESQLSVARWQAWIAATALAGVAACVAVSFRELRQGWHATNRGALGAALLLGLAAAAFAATRPAAADVRLRIPHVPPNQQCYLERNTLPPIVGQCVALPRFTPIVEVPGPRHNFELEQRPVNGLVLTGKRLIRQIAAKGGQSIGLVGDRDVRVASIDWAQIREAGYDSVFLFMQAPSTRLKTRTIGVVSLWPRCCVVEIRLDRTGEPAETHATYDDLVRAANAASQRGGLLTLAP